MNFDRESKSEDFFFLFFFFFFVLGGGWGWGERGGEVGGSNRKKTNRYSLIFYAHALYKISSFRLKWFSSFNTNKRSNGQVKGITLPMLYGIQP